MAHRANVPPESARMTPQEAATEILHLGLGYSAPVPRTTAPIVLDRARLSLPYGQKDPIPVKEVLNSVDRNMVDEFRTEMLLSAEEWAGFLESNVMPSCYWDPSVKSSRRVCLGLLRCLYDAKLIGFTNDPIERIGIFGVKKKQQGSCYL